MNINENSTKAIFTIVERQLKTNDPPETNETFRRLKKEGFCTLVIKQLISKCIAFEISITLKHKGAYNNERYVRHLKELPSDPVDD